MFKFSTRSLLLLLITLGLTSVSLPAQALLPHVLVSQSKTEPESNSQTDFNALQQKASNLVNLLAQEKYQEVIDQLSPELRPEWTPEKLRALWEKLLSSTGPFQKELKSIFAETVNADLVSVTTQFEKTTGDFLITFNKKQEVIGIDYPKVDTIEQISEQFVDDLVKKDFAGARGYLHPFLKIEIYPQQVQKKWEAVLAAAGPFKKSLAPEVKKGLNEDDADLVLIPMEFEKVTAYMVLIFDQYKRIIGVDFPTVNNGQ